MSAPLVRTATAGSLALALALALPAAAFAGSEEEPGRSGASSGSSAEHRQDGERRSDGAAREEASAGAKDEKKADRDEKKADTKAGERGGAATGDPRGNNGTVKIDGLPFDDGRGNEPHVGCTFAVDFYGFDKGDTASITLTGHAPTGGGLLHSQSGTVISDDAAGGGQDRDATLVFSVQDQLSELLSVTPHPQQGWHVKLAVDVDSAPGGAKQKVFWIDCPTAPAVGGTTTNPATGGGTTTTTPTLGGGTSTIVPNTALPATVVSGTTVKAAERQDALTLGAGTATLAAGAAEQGVSAQGAAQPSALPFTGTHALLYLLGLGAAAVGVGAVAHRMGRREADSLV